MNMISVASEAKLTTDKCVCGNLDKSQQPGQEFERSEQEREDSFNCMV